MAEIDSVPNNPAGRLHALVREVHAFPKAAGRPIDDMWAQILRIPREDHPRLYSAIARIALLPRQTRDAFQSIKGLDHSRYISWVSPAEEALTVRNFGSTAQALIAAFYPDRMNLISICDDLLRPHCKGKSIATDSLLELQTQVQEALAQLQNADIPNGLKEYIARHYRIIEAALADARVEGHPALSRAFEHSVGAIVVNRSVYLEAKQTPFGGRLIELAAAFVVLMQAGEYAGHLLTQAAETAVEIRDFVPSESPSADGQCDRPTAALTGGSGDETSDTIGTNGIG